MLKLYSECRICNFTLFWTLTFNKYLYILSLCSIIVASLSSWIWKKEKKVLFDQSPQLYRLTDLSCSLLKLCCWVSSCISWLCCTLASKNHSLDREVSELLVPVSSKYIIHCCLTSRRLRPIVPFFWHVGSLLFGVFSKCGGLIRNNLHLMTQFSANFSLICPSKMYNNTGYRTISCHQCRISKNITFQTTMSM